jgi:HEAT repeat protein
VSNRHLNQNEIMKQAVSMLHSADRAARMEAVAMLGHLQSIEAVPALVEGLHISDVNVRCAVVAVLRSQSLQSPAGSHAVLALNEALYDSSLAVRRSAARALAEIASSPDDEIAAAGLIHAFVQGSWDVRLSVEHVIDEMAAQPEAGKLRRDLEPGLIEAMEVGSCDVRRAAAKLLGVIGSDEAVLPLVNALRDEYEEVRIAAAVSLGQLRSAVGIPGLLEALRDSHREVRRSAVKSLGQIGAVCPKAGASAVPGLIGMLWDNDWNMRRIAAEALNRIGPEATRAQWRRGQADMG